MKTLVVALAAIVLLLGSVIALGDATRAGLGIHDRYGIALQHVECSTPPGMSRDDFMSEVQYVGNLPTKLDSLDPHLAPDIAVAFGKHPRVDAVERVEVGAGRVWVQLRFRAAPSLSRLP